MSSAQPLRTMTVEPRRNTCSVLCAPDAKQVSLDLCFDWPSSPLSASSGKAQEGLISKLLVRDADEEASKTLERIRMLCPCVDAPSKKSGKRLSREDILASCPPVRALGVPDGAAPESTTYAELDAALPNGQFFKQLRELFIGSQRVAAVYNPPAITSVQPLPRPYVGLPLFCAPPATLNCTAEGSVVYEWCVDESTDNRVTALRCVSTQPLFYPTAELVDKTLVLRLSVNPSAGPWLNLRTPAPVAALPPPMERWSETPNFISAASALRVTSYNVLYDGFCDTKACRERIYPFASDEILSIENRQVRILQELIAHHSDVICLQECGKHLFHDYLLPSMQALGYDGFYVNKSGNVQEGCALLFRTARFEMMEQSSFPLNWTTLESRYPALAARVAAHKEFRDALNHITTIASFCRLRQTSTGKELVVGNTHLFYHANGCHIRILQAFMLLDALSQFAGQAASTSTTTEGVPVPAPLSRGIVLCGDFNCTHPTGAYRLLTTGQVERTHRSWEKGKLFWWGCDRQLGYSEEEFETLTGKKEKTGKRAKKEDSETIAEPVSLDSASAAKAVAERQPLTDCFHEDLHVPVRLCDAYDRMDPSLPWTNYTMTFREVIDYILFSENMDVLRTIPIPPESELSDNFALPNKKYPSDHVSLVADLVFRD